MYEEFGSSLACALHFLNCCEPQGIFSRSHYRSVIPPDLVTGTGKLVILHSSLDGYIPRLREFRWKGTSRPWGTEIWHVVNGIKERLSVQWSHGDSALLKASAALQHRESENIEEILVLQRIKLVTHKLCRAGRGAETE